MASLVPPYGARGIYSLKAPYDRLLNQGELYTCGAIRNFRDIENSGKDVFKTYYEPHDLATSAFNTDRKNDVVIITLLSDKVAPVYVPSSYILAFPDLSNRPYQRVVLSVDLGPLPDALDLTFVKGQVATAVATSFGVQPVVNVAVAAMSGVVTGEEHEAREVARQARVTNNVTDYAKFLAAEQRNAELAERLRIMENIVRDNGLLEG